VGVLDRDVSVLSKDFVQSLSSSDGFKVTAIDEANVNKSLIDRKLDAVVTIPAGYEDGIYGGKPINMDVVSLKGQESTAWLGNYISIYTRNLSDLSVAAGNEKNKFDIIYKDYRTNPLELDSVKVKDESTGKMMTVTSLGFLIMFVMLGAGFTSQWILSEKRMRTYYRICSAPVRSRDYIGANTIASMLIVVVQVILIQASLKYVFRINTYVPDLILFAVLFSFGLATVALCLMITALSSSSYMSSTLTTLIITPTCMISGCFWPVTFMPQAMQKLSYIVPQRWALEAVQKLQSGGGIGEITLNLAVIAAFAAAMFSIAAKP
jgi:ABC-2 type transport system permease protein